MFTRLQTIIKYVCLAVLILWLGSRQLAVIKTELADLREFYDPDTVDLMHWIADYTHQGRYSPICSIYCP